MTPFAVGFLNYCAERGYDDDRVDAMLEKVAWPSVSGVSDATLKSLAIFGGVPLGLGLLGGHALGTAAANTPVPGIDIGDAQAAELTRALQRATEEAKRRRAFLDRKQKEDAASRPRFSY